jgi:toxin secretion/phage lysis holin
MKDVVEALDTLTLKNTISLMRISPGNGFYYKSFIAGICSMFTFLFGGWDLALKVLVCFMVLDYMTGWICAAYRNCVSSRRGLNGLYRKIGMLCAVVAATLMDHAFSSGTLCRKFVIFVLSANEITSILENLELIGVKIPGISKILSMVNVKQEKHSK